MIEERVLLTDDGVELEAELAWPEGRQAGEPRAAARGFREGVTRRAE